MYILTNINISGTHQNLQNKTSVHLRLDQPKHSPPVAQLVECPLRGTGGHGFDPGPQHTKVVKMVLAASHLVLRLTVELGLVDPVSGLCDWVLYHVKCLRHDTSVRQHYKREHWAPCRIQTPSWYDWKIVGSDVKSEQTTRTESDYQSVPSLSAWRSFGSWTTHW